MEWSTIAVNSAVVGCGMWYLRWWIGRDIKQIDDKMDRIHTKIEGFVTNETCLERSKRCSEEKCRKIDALKKEKDEQWGVINRHGHKGLIGDGNKVVRM